MSKIEKKIKEEICRLEKEIKALKLKENELTAQRAELWTLENQASKQRYALEKKLESLQDKEIIDVWVGLLNEEN